MPRSIVTVFAVRLLACLLCFGAGSAFGQASPQLKSMRGVHFEVIGLDQRSVFYVHELGQFSAQIAERYLKREGMVFPQPILVSLRPEAHAGFEGDYRLRIVERGAVELDIRWEAGMTLERTCRAMSEALLVQYAFYNHGRNAAAEIRLWPIVALAGDIYLSLRPAKIVDLLERTRRQDTLSAESALSALLGAPLTTGTGAQSDADAAYWLLEAMKSGNFDRRVLRGLFQQAVAGVVIEEALLLAVQPSEPTAEALTLDMWWSARLATLLGREYDVVDTMDVSREWLAVLARFDTPFSLESGEASLNLRSLWTHRKQAEVRERIEARYQILLLRMGRANPAYYNPARSLGVLFEALLDDRPAYQYLHALTLYLSDWEDAKELHEALKHALQEL